MGSDILFMQRAIMLAEKATGQTSPNPIVGCVIVKAGKVVAEGWHKRCGTDHAEVVALKKAGDKAKGATLYVTLEPCSHWGRTPPCVEAVLKAGIKKVVVAMTDPNPVNNGKSLTILKKNGVEVVLGVCEHEAREMNRAFITYMTRKRPFVVAKIAQSLDGKTTTHPGASPWITAEETRLWAKKKRDQFDAILVGVNTIIEDNPELNAPSKALKKIVVDSRLRISEKAKIFKVTRPEDLILATTQQAPQAKLKRLIKQGVTVMIVPAKAGRVDLKTLFKELAKIEIASILIEGGAVVVGSALKEKLVDRLHLYLAPKVIGEARAKGLIDGLHIQRLARTLKFEITDIHRIGSDAFIELCSPESLK